MAIPKNFTPDAVRIVPNENDHSVTQEEAEARLHQEGYQSFCWYDVPGAIYPDHSHTHDECLWVLKGEIVFRVANRDYSLKKGDRLYLPARTPHTAQVPQSGGVTYLIGQKRKH